MAEEHLFRKKPVVVKARRYESSHGPRELDTPHGFVKVEAGDWIVTDVEGNQYPCRDSLFRATHEPVDEAGNVIPWPGEKRELRIVHGFPCPACQAHLLLDIREEK